MRSVDECLGVCSLHGPITAQACMAQTLRKGWQAKEAHAGATQQWNSGAFTRSGLTASQVSRLIGPWLISTKAKEASTTSEMEL